MHARQHPRGQQRMAAELEEVVVDADAVDAEQLGPDAGERRSMSDRGRDGGRQTRGRGRRRACRLPRCAGRRRGRAGSAAAPGHGGTRRRDAGRVRARARTPRARRRCGSAAARCACQSARMRVGHVHLGRHADLAPGAPVDRDDAAPCRGARGAVDEGVEHRIGRGVVACAGRADDGIDRADAARRSRAARRRAAAPARRRPLHLRREHGARLAPRGRSTRQPPLPGTPAAWITPWMRAEACARRARRPRPSPARRRRRRRRTSTSPPRLRCAGSPRSPAPAMLGRMRLQPGVPLRALRQRRATRSAPGGRCTLASQRGEREPMPPRPPVMR